MSEFRHFRHYLARSFLNFQPWPRDSSLPSEEADLPTFVTFGTSPPEPFAIFWADPEALACVLLCACCVGKPIKAKGLGFSVLSL